MSRLKLVDEDVSLLELNSTMGLWDSSWTSSYRQSRELFEVAIIQAVDVDLLPAVVEEVLNAGRISRMTRNCRCDWMAQDFVEDLLAMKLGLSLVYLSVCSTDHQGKTKKLWSSS